MRVSGKKFLRNGGFSLAELMVAVAIISILAAIAVPNYQEFSHKAKMSQPKIALSALYTAEKAYYTEYLTYSPRLDAIGIVLEGNIYSDIGFKVDTAPPAGAPQGTAACLTYCDPLCSLSSAGGICRAEALNSLDSIVPSYANSTGFLAETHMHFGSYSGLNQQAHTFTIDHGGTLREVIPAY